MQRLAITKKKKRKEGRREKRKGYRCPFAENAISYSRTLSDVDASRVYVARMQRSSMRRASLLQPLACFSLAVYRENCLQRDGIVVDPRIFQLYLFEVERPWKLYFYTTAFHPQSDETKKEIARDLDDYNSIYLQRHVVVLGATARPRKQLETESLVSGCRDKSRGS